MCVLYLIFPQRIYYVYQPSAYSFYCSLLSPCGQVHVEVNTSLTDGSCYPLSLESLAQFLSPHVDKPSDFVKKRVKGNVHDYGRGAKSLNNGSPGVYTPR